MNVVQSPRIVRTLQSVSYLVSSNGDSDSMGSQPNDRIFTRLLETFQFVLEIMDCRPDFPCSEPARISDYLLPGGEGWKAIIRVRMLHGVARARACARAAAGAPFALPLVPINQEDLSATSVFVLC